MQTDSPQMPLRYVGVNLLLLCLIFVHLLSFVISFISRTYSNLQLIFSVVYKGIEQIYMRWVLQKLFLYKVISYFTSLCLQETIGKRVCIFVCNCLTCSFHYQRFLIQQWIWYNIVLKPKCLSRRNFLVASHYEVGCLFKVGCIQLI